MRRHECPPAERLEQILALDPSDPRRAGMEDCPRCQARILSFRSFLEPGETPPEGDLEDARRRLSEVIVAEKLRSSVPARQRPNPLHGLHRWLGWRPALGLAGALAVVAILLRYAGGPTRPGEAILPRAEAPAGGEQATMLLSTETSGGSTVLRWTRLPQADSYLIVFHTLHLTEILRVPSGPDTSLALTASIQERIAQAGGQALWQVIAVSGGDEVFTSPPAAVRTP